MSRDRYLKNIAYIVKQSQLELGKKAQVEMLLRKVARCESRITTRRLLGQLAKLLFS